MEPPSAKGPSLAAPSLAVMITTRNRRDDLQLTLAELRRLQPAPDAIVVCADGCDDGTADMVRAEFPECRVIEQPEGRGSIPSRDRMLREAGCDLVLSLDDDSHPVEADFVAETKALFASRPRLAVAVFPQRSEEFPESMAREDFGPERLVGSYTSSGAVIRREAYLALPGYVAEFGHAYEEPDFALQCIAAGWEVKFLPRPLVRHRYTARGRNEIRTHHLHARNEIWSALLRCPWQALPAVIAWRVIRQFGYAWRRGMGWAAREPLWWWRCLNGAPALWRRRNPVPWRSYRRWLASLGDPSSKARASRQ